MAQRSHLAFHIILTFIFTALFLLCNAQPFVYKIGPIGTDSVFNGIQKQNPINWSPPSHFFSILKDSAANASNHLPSGNHSKVRLNEASNCNTYTYTARLQAPTGDRLTLIDLSPMLSGETIVATNQANANTKSILLVKLAQDGSIAQQLQLRIDGRPVAGSDMQVRQQREVLLAGYFFDNAKQIFLASFDLNFQLKWVKLYDLDVAVEMMKADLRSDFGNTLAVQSQSSYKILKLSVDGNIQWATSIERTNGMSLQNVNYQSTNTVLFSQKDFSGIVPTHSLAALNGVNGQLIDIRRTDHNQDSVLLTDFKGFDNRFASAGVVKKSDGSTSVFSIQGQLREASFFNFYYTLPASFPTTGNVLASPSLDATAAYDPQINQLYLITQHHADNIRPRRQRQFAITGSHQLNSFVKTVDAGFMFGLTGSDGQILLMKTDSIGILSGCDSRPLQVGFKGDLQIQHPLVNSAAQSLHTVKPTNGTLTSLIGAGKIAFDCREKYCPPPPIEDSCNPSFFKILRSNYFGSGVYSAFIQNNRFYTYGQIYEDISKPAYTLTGMLGMYDLKGNYLKGIRTYIDGQPAASGLWGHRNGQSVAAYNLGKASEKQHLLICLYDANLNPKWTLPIETYYSFNAYVLAPYVADVEYDENGNIYLVVVQYDNFKEDNNIAIIKVDEKGTFLWSKVYQLNNRNSAAANATLTPEALVIVAESTKPGAFSMAISKNDGSLISKSSIANNQKYSTDGESHKLVKFYKDKIYYVCAFDKDEQGVFSIGAATLNTLGQPEKFFYYTSGFNSRFEASLYNDKIDITSAINTMNGYKTAKAQLNLSLDVNHAYAYDTDYYFGPTALQHDSIGSLYGLGFLYALDEYYETSHFLIKYNDDGSIGSCAKEPIAFTPVEVKLVDHPIDIELSNKTITPGGNFQLQVIVEDNGLQVAQIKCLSQSNCKELRLKGPNDFCDPTKEHIIKVEKSIGCSLQIRLAYDTSVIKEVTVREDEIGFKTNRPGSTWLKATLNTGCNLLQDSIRISVPTAAGTLLSLGPDRLLCPNDSLTLRASKDFSQYRWNTGSNDSTLQVKTPGTYWIEVSDGCSGIQRDTVIISKALVPLLDAGSDTAICLNSSFSRTGTNGFSNYQWYRLSDKVSISSTQSISQSVFKSDSFKVIAYTVEGCMEMDSFSVTVKRARPFDLGKDTSLCKGDDVEFIVPSGYKSYLWNTGQTSNAIQVKAMGIYFVSVLDTNDCVTTDTIKIARLRDLPIPELGTDRSLCMGSSIILNPGTFVKYQWMDSDTNKTKIANSVGRYTVTVEDQWGCSGADSMSITALLTLPENFLNSTDSICQYESLKIEPTTRFANYSWSNGSISNSITTSVPGILVLKVVDNNGCAGVDSIRIVQKTCIEGVYVPNAFTPNNDGRNDNFKPLTFGNIVYYDFKIFNRYGEIVFNSSVPGKAWDGMWKGLQQPSGNFAWRCEYQLDGAERKSIKGTVMLIR